MLNKPTPTTLPSNPSQWLQHMQASGYSLALAELLQYRLQRSHKLPTARRTPARGLSGNQLSKTKGRGMEFDEVRHYQAGDDIRAIDWRVTARTGQTHTKLYREEKERPVFFFVDFSPSMYFGSQLLYKSVQAAHVTANLAWRYAYRGDRVGGLVFNDSKHSEVKPMARDKGVLRLLHELVAAHQGAPQQASISGDATTFQANLQRLRQLVKTGAQVFLISDFHHLNARSIQELRSLSAHNSVQAIILTDPLELRLPNVAATRVQAKDDDFIRDFWLGDSRTNALYQRQAGDWLQQRQDMLQQARIPSLLIDAATPLSLQREALS